MMLFLKPRLHIAFAYLSLLSICLFWPVLAIAQTKCTIALVLAADVSGSVDSTEFHMQKIGMAKTFRDKEVIELITHLPGGVAVTLTHWSGGKSQRLVVDWNTIENAADAYAFADKIENDKRVRTGSLTAIGKALLHADQLLGSNPTSCYKKVIDLSSDGRSNTGPDAGLVADILAAKDIFINALVIVNNDKTLIPYFQQNIIRGAGAFVQPAHGYGDFANAFKRKLLRELTPQSAEIGIRQILSARFEQNFK